MSVDSGSVIMALQGPIPVTFAQVFPHGCYVVGEVEAVKDFDASTNGRFVQSRDKTTGELIWQVAVMDADPTVKPGQKTVAVKILSPVQPAPPALMPDLPFPRREGRDAAAAGLQPDLGQGSEAGEPLRRPLPRSSSYGQHVRLAVGCDAAGADEPDGALDHAGRADLSAHRERAGSDDRRRHGKARRGRSQERRSTGIGHVTGTEDRKRSGNN